MPTALLTVLEEENVKFEFEIADNGTTRVKSLANEDAGRLRTLSANFYQKRGKLHIVSSSQQ